MVVVIIIYKEWLLLALERGLVGWRHLPGTLTNSQKTIAKKDWEPCPGGFILCFQHIRHYFSKTLTQKKEKKIISIFMYKVYYCVSQTLHCSTALPDDFNRTMEIKKEKGRISGSKKIGKHAMICILCV